MTKPKNAKKDTANDTSEVLLEEDEVVSRYSELKSTLEDRLKEIKKEKGADYKPKIAIEMHKDPDPDSMACAYFMDTMCAGIGYDPIIIHTGGLGWAQNTMMRTLLHIPLKRYTKPEVDLDVESIDAFFFVDHSGKRSEMFEKGMIPKEKLVGIIDHHDLEVKAPDASFIDKQNVGAASSIFASYLKDGALEDFFKDENAIKSITTALTYGIRTDTHKLMRNVTQFDYKMYEYLLEKVDHEIISKIERPPIPLEWRKAHVKGLTDSSIRSEGGVYITSVGIIEPEIKGVIAEVSDYLIRDKEILTVYTIGIVKDDEIQISVRTKDPDYIFDKALQEIFSDVEIKNKGGRDGAGGICFEYQFDKAYLMKPDSSPEINKIIENGIMELCCHYIFQNHKKLESTD